MWNDASGDFEQGLESLWEEKWGGVKSGGRWGGGGCMRGRANSRMSCQRIICQLGYLAFHKTELLL